MRKTLLETKQEPDEPESPLTKNKPGLKLFDDGHGPDEFGGKRRVIRVRIVVAGSASPGGQRVPEHSMLYFVLHRGTHFVVTT
jgi:hypothetical protein